MRPSEHLAWAAGIVAPPSTDRVLEVGCGHGVLVSLLAERVPECGDGFQWPKERKPMRFMTPA